MSHIGYFKLLPLVLLVSSCTFGEGPELVLPESEQVANSGIDSSNLQAAPESGSQVEPQEMNVSQAEPADSTTPVDDAPTGSGVSDPGVATEPATGNSSSGDAGSSSMVTLDNAGSSSMPAAEPVDDAPGGLVRIPRTDSANAPIIDGDTIEYVPGTEILGGEWRNAAQFNVAGEPLGINNFMFGNAEQVLSGTYHHWAAMHDGEYLYLAVISDDKGEHFYDTNEARKPWKDDSVELYFDGNYSQLTEYDGVDDFHFTVNLFDSAGLPNENNAANTLLTKNPASATPPSDLTFKTGPRQGPTPVGSNQVRKDIYEFRIKLSELNIQIESPFGFEVQLNDDDDGGTRDAKRGWQHPEGEDASNDITWQNPGFMGTAILIR